LIFTLLIPTTQGLPFQIVRIISNIIEIRCETSHRRFNINANINNDGRIPIDNDQSEQTIRPLTIGRNNWLFLGHPEAAPGRLQLYSVVSSAHRHHLMIYDYLEDVLRKLADARQNHPADLALDSPYVLDLLPDRWALAHPQFVRLDRIEDREMVFDAKRWRRAQGRVQARAIQAASTQ
jgi:hypothetical protein